MRRFRFHLSVDVEGEDVEEARASLLVQNPHVGECRIRGVETLLSPGQRVTVTLNSGSTCCGVYVGEVDMDIVRWTRGDGRVDGVRVEHFPGSPVAADYGASPLLGVMKFALDDGRVVYGYDVVRWEFEGVK